MQWQRVKHSSSSAPIKILSRRRYQQLLDEQNRLRHQYHQLEDRLRTLESEKRQLEEKFLTETTDLKSQLATRHQKAKKLERLQQERQTLTEEVDLWHSREISNECQKPEFNRTQTEKLWRNRLDLIELYIDRMYALAKRFSIANKQMRKNRGLFLVLVDGRNMVDGNFSEFHDGQPEYLMQSQYQGIAQLPHLFSAQMDEVLDNMGEKIIIRDGTGEIMGYEERDGALLIDLRGVAFRSCMMVEGVRTHRVCKSVEPLEKGNAKHNAALYASSLDEVIVTIVISEETSEVTMFRSGRFIKRYNPYTDVETVAEQKIVPIQRERGAMEERA